MVLKRLYQELEGQSMQTDRPCLGISAEWKGQTLSTSSLGRMEDNKRW